MNKPDGLTICAAKTALMRHYAIPEPVAHRTLRTLAMANRVKLAAAAQRVLELLGQTGAGSRRQEARTQ